MEFYYEMRPFEIIHEVYCLSVEVANRAKQWHEAVTEDEAEFAECAYYDCVDHFRMVKKVMIKRGLETAYNKYVKFLQKEGLE